MADLPAIHPDQLQLGVYVHLDVGWLGHPFSFNNFKIKTEEQLEIIRSLNLKKVRWDPARSDAKPLPRQATAVAPNQATPVPEIVSPDGASATEAVEQIEFASAAVAAKAARQEIHRKHKQQYGVISKKFHETVLVVKGINRNILSQPEATLDSASKLIEGIVESMLSATDVLLQFMGNTMGDDQHYHGLNVSVLAVMLGKKLGANAEICHVLGMGGLLHDIGLADVPSKILTKQDPLTKAEREFRDQHPVYGLRMAKQIKLSAPLQSVIHSHHECFDGTGFPQGLKGDTIPLAARIVAVCNAYDNLCNPINIANALTPHEALSLMYSQQRMKFDNKALQALIKSLGVYPPGSLIKLSNEALAVVTQVNTSAPLKPIVQLYDESCPADDAPILDLAQEPDVSIARALRPSVLPKPILDYLCPRKRVSYYFDATQEKTT